MESEDKYSCSTCKYYQNTKDEFVCPKCKEVVNEGRFSLSEWMPKENSETNEVG